ncbi:MAG: uncharacterized protein QG670_1114 [Thermoproteota archaeon]|nr:uncharacterized protein [Thermoproteota archaeon]
MKKLDAEELFKTPPKETANKIYLKALSIQETSDVDSVRTELEAGNIVIARITPLARKSVDDARQAVDELCAFIKELGGDIARLGEERLVITPPSIKIWRKSSEIIE